VGWCAIGLGGPLLKPRQDNPHANQFAFDPAVLAGHHTASDKRLDRALPTLVWHAIFEDGAAQGAPWQFGILALLRALHPQVNELVCIHVCPGGKTSPADRTKSGAQATPKNTIAKAVATISSQNSNRSFMPDPLRFANASDRPRTHASGVPRALQVPIWPPTPALFPWGRLQFQNHSGKGESRAEDCAGYFGPEGTTPVR
jgi:hypothetical protein